MIQLSVRVVECGVASVAERIVAPALVGRVDEVRRLVEAISTRPALVAVEGEAGIGKTRLVEELLRVAPDGHRLVGRCHGIREAFPLGPVIEAVRQVEPELARRPMTGVAGALRPVLPELAGVLPPEPAPLADRVAVRHRVFRALREVLAGVGRLVLVLEDLHWADEQTVELLGYLVSDPPPELAVVLTYRGAEVPAAVPALVARAPAGTATTRLTLGPLDPVQTGALAAAILGVDQVSGDFASYLCERTAGLPFAMEEVLALLRARGSLPRQGDHLTRQVLEALEVPSGIRDWVRERVSSLSPAARAVVEAAAVLQVPVPERVLAGAATASAAATTGAGDRSAGLAEAVASGLLTDDRDLLGFRHLLAAQAVYQGLPGVRRRALHTWAASRLTTALHPVPLGQVVHHLWRAGDLTAWSATAIAAADQAVQLGHDQEAVRLLEQVLREAPLDAAQRATVAVKLGRASVHVRPTPQVAELLAEVLATDPPRPVRGQLRFLLAGLLNFLGGDPARQYALYQGAVDDLAGRPDLQAWAMAGLGVPMVPGVPLAEHLEWLRRILALLPEITDPAFRVWLLGKVAMVRIPIGDPQWRPIVDQLRSATGDAPRQSQEVNAYYSVGAAACYGGRHELADQLVQTGLAGAATAESEALAQALRSVAALLDYCRGRWDGLAGRVQALLAELAPGTRTRLDVEVAAAGMALARGDLAAAERRLGEVTARAEQLGCFDLLPLPVAMQIRLALLRGQPAEAMAAAERAEAVLEPTAVWASLARLLPGLVQARTEAGQRWAAGQLLDRWGAELDRRDAPLAAATVPHARGFLAAAGATAGRPDRAAGEFLTAAAGYDRLGCPYEAAQAREQAALVLLAPAGLAGGGRSAALAPLRAALVGYHRAGAGWDLARAAGLARRHGLPVPSPHRLGRRGYGTRLSPRESGVAELAATGLTNKEIAERLFLSPSTVNKHVRAAMRKLGVRSRTELAYRHGAGNGGGNGDRGNNGSD